MGYEGTVNILCSLSKLLYGNIDLIEEIYKKKKLIETNETLLHYLLIGLQTERLYNYQIITLNDKTTITTTDHDSKINNLDEILKTIIVKKFHTHWEYMSSKSLKNDKQWCQKIMIESLFIDNFFLIRKFDGVTGTVIGIPTMKQKIKTLNRIVHKRGFIYLDLIKEEFKNSGIDICILLDESGEIESIFGGVIE